MGRWPVAAVVALVGGLLLTPARPAAVAAEAPARTHCTFTAAIALVPGLSVVPSSGTFSSGGETGTVSCDGPVRGIVPTGPGTLGVEGRYGTKDPDTCFGGEGEGRFSFTFPTRHWRGEALQRLHVLLQPGRPVRERLLRGRVR